MCELRELKKEAGTALRSIEVLKEDIVSAPVVLNRKGVFEILRSVADDAVEAQLRWFFELYVDKIEGDYIRNKPLFSKNTDSFLNKIDELKTSLVAIDSESAKLEDEARTLQSRLQKELFEFKK
jgi:hypothetical protein